MRPLFSVVIPTYNRAALLRVAIQSVLDQEYVDFELIIMDDGSTDNTKEIVDSFSDRRIRYVYQQNGELSAARNTGVKNALGEYLCFLDDDDVYLPNHLFVLQKNITQNESKKVVFRTSLVIRKKGENDEKGVEWHDTGSPLKFVWEGFVGITTFCFPIDLFKKYQFPEQFILFEDKHFLARVQLEYQLVQIKDAYTVVYNIYENSRSYTAYKDDARLQNQIDCVEHLFTTHSHDLIKHLGPNALNRKCSDFYYQAAQQASRVGDRAYVLKRLKQANKYDAGFIRKLKYFKVWVKSMLP